MDSRLQPGAGIAIAKDYNLVAVEITDDDIPKVTAIRKAKCASRKEGVNFVSQRPSGRRRGQRRHCRWSKEGADRTKDPHC